MFLKCTKTLKSVFHDGSVLHLKTQFRNTTSHIQFSTSVESDDSYTDIREAVKNLCAKFSGAYWRECDRQGKYPKDFVRALQESGYLSLMIPETYGGSGLGLTAACSVLEEIHASGCNGAAAHAQMYTMASILQYGSDDQKKQFLPDIASGKLRLQAFGVSEPNSGTDTLSLETTAQYVPPENTDPHTIHPDGKFIVNGQKMWTSRAEYSDLMLLLARTTTSSTEKQSVKRQNQLSLLLVDLREHIIGRTAQDSDSKGSIEIRPVETMMNHSTTQVFFDSVEIPASNLIGAPGEGFKCILSSMNAERTLIAAECIGDGRYFIDRAVSYASERRVFGRAIGQNQGIQFPIAECYASVQSAKLMVYKAAKRFDLQESCGEEANMAKYLAAEASWKAADVCIQTHGGYGFAKDYDIERKFRETRLYRVAPISTNLILSFLAEKILGMPRSY